MTKAEAIQIMYGYSQDYLEHLQEKASRFMEIGNFYQADIEELEQALDVMKGVDDGTQ